MKRYEHIELLGRAFAYGEIDAFVGCMNAECKYHSDYAHKHLNTAEQIEESMRSVYATVQKKTAEGENCTYSFEVVALADVLKDGVSLNDLRQRNLFEVGEYGIVLYQYGDKHPVAVVFAHFNPGDQITEITLSRSTKWFNVQFYGDDGLADSEKDIPYTVKPLTNHDRQVKELQSAWTHQNHAEAELQDENIYIWRQADEYIKGWLKNRGYNVRESQVFEDCIGYRCNRNGYAYTVFMFAYGKERTTQLDGDYCSKFFDEKFSRESTILVVYLNVKRTRVDDKYNYTVCNYAGDEDRDLELWRLTNVNGKPILQFYPRKELIDLSWKLMYAFNHDDMDVYECIIRYLNPSIIGPGDPGYSMNGAVYGHLHRLHEKYGDMKLGYVRYNDVVYSAVPYLEGYGYFGFTVDNNLDKISDIKGYGFDGEEREIAEFIRTDIMPEEDLFDYVPRPTGVTALDPVSTERFALKIDFDNGECRKYVLPIDSDQENDEVVGYRSHSFTDAIWKSAEICKKHLDTSPFFPNRRPGIKFKNEYCISSMICYEEGTRYSEPEKLNTVVYEDEKRKLTALWKWNAESLWEDEETGLLKVLLSGSAFNWYGKSTFASIDGKRLCSLDFDYLDNFHEDRALVCVAGKGYGFVDPKMNFVIPMKYERADEFNNGKAKVELDGVWYTIDTSGKLTRLSPEKGDDRYQDIGEYSEGLCKVSTMKLGFMDLAYHSDYSEIAGTWGYVDEAGNEVIKPQYIYAYDFENGMAIVCKGKWTIDKKWDNECNQGRYWTEEELWGAIDTAGNEVIPFIFDEIKHFDDSDVFMAHYGGWKEGHWGVIDNRGNWLAEPIFKDIDYEYHDGLFAFYADDKWSGDDVPLGIYDVKQRKVIFEPQFFDVSFRDDGYIEVEVFDKDLGRRIEKMIDLDGNERFHSEYTSIYGWKEPFEVTIRDENGTRHGLIDKDGTVLLPCKYDVAWGGISYEQRRIVFEQDGKQGIVDFDDNVIVEPKYLEIHGMTNPLLTVRVGDKDSFQEGLITPDGKEVLPAKSHRIAWSRDNKIICCSDGECIVYQYEVKNN